MALYRGNVALGWVASFRNAKAGEGHENRERPKKEGKGAKTAKRNEKREGYRKPRDGDHFRGFRRISGFSWAEAILPR